MKTEDLLRLIRVGVSLSVAALLGGVAAGCENSHAKLGEGHDFGVNNPGVVAAMGDSITEGIPDVPSYPPILAGMSGKTVINFGAGGMKSGYGADTIDGVLASSHPGFVIILFGANDAIHGVPVDYTINNIRYMIRAALANKTIPVVCTVMPIVGMYYMYNGGVEAINAVLPGMAEQEGAAVVDLYSLFQGHPEFYFYNGLHPNELGAQAIARSIADLF